MKELIDKRRRLLFHIFILGLLIIVLHIFSEFYSHLFAMHLFPALQMLRCKLFTILPFSIGDVIYCFAVAYLLYTIFVFVKDKNWKRKPQWLLALLRTVRLTLAVSILLFLFWSSLYAQPKLSERMELPSSENVSNKMLINFDSVLIQRMNDLVPHIDSLGIGYVNEVANASYHQSILPFNLFAKSSLFRNNLSYLGIEGYFNPFSGEAQINPNLPFFMLPFVVTHEMAHQTGIAAEDDANLSAYIACVQSGNKSFQYSAYLNIWMYTHRRVFRMDSLKAKVLKSNLNQLSLNHLMVLKQRSIQYHTFLDDWSTYVFDVFLKMGNQHDGIGSYRNVAYSALCWEQKRKQNADTLH